MAKPTIKIGHLSITDHLILGVTKDKLEKGKETFNNCSVETETMTGWNQIADALSDGNIDMAFVLAPTAMDLYNSGVKIKLILLGHKTGSIFIKNKKANIQKIEDLKGKVVIIPYQLSVHNMLLHKLISEKGLKPGTGNDPGVDVKLEVMAPMQMPMAVQYDDEGEIGGFIVAEPFGSQAILEGYGEEFYLSRDLWPNHPCCVVVAKDEIIGKYPDAVLEVCKSFVDSGKFIPTNVEEASSIGASFLSQNVDVIKNVLSDKDRVKTNELMPVIEDLDKVQNYMADKMNILKNKIDMGKFVDTQFAKAAGAV